MQSIDTPWLLTVRRDDQQKYPPRDLTKKSPDLLPNMSFRNQTSIITSPIAASPPRALVQVLEIVLECRFDFTLSVVLNPCRPLICNKPSRNKVIVIRIELILPPSLCFKSIQEERTLQNLGPECTSSPRHAGGSTVNTMGCRNFKVASLNISSSKPIECTLGKGAIAYSLDSLTWPNTTNLCVLKGCK